MRLRERLDFLDNRARWKGNFTLLGELELQAGNHHVFQHLGDQLIMGRQRRAALLDLLADNLDTLCKFRLSDHVVFDDNDHPIQKLSRRDTRAQHQNQG